MQISNPKTEIPYWEEGQSMKGNGNLYHWYQKGFWKRYLRKKFIKKRLKEVDE
jgi:hypothetical protein